MIYAFCIWGSDSPLDTGGCEWVSSTEWTSVFHSCGEVSEQYDLSIGFRHMNTMRMRMENGWDSSVSVYETVSIQPHSILSKNVLLVHWSL